MLHMRSANLMWNPHSAVDCVLPSARPRGGELNYHIHSDGYCLGSVFFFHSLFKFRPNQSPLDNGDMESACLSCWLLAVSGLGVLREALWEEHALGALHRLLDSLD